MHVEEAEDLRLGKAERVQDGAGLEGGVGGQVHDELHAHRPVARVVAFGQAELRVELLADGADRAVADDGERGVDVHARHEAVARLALLIHALVEQADADDFVVLDQRLGHRRAGPDLDRAGALDLGANPLHELAHREHQPAGLVQERRRPRQFDRLMLERQQSLKRPDAGIRRAQGPGAPARADRVEQIDDFLLRDRGGHGDFFGVEVGEGGAQPARARHHARDAEADVVGALVAEDLRRRARHDGAFDRGRAVRIDELLREGGEEARCGRPEPDADDVRVHALAFDLRRARCVLFGRVH